MKALRVPLLLFVGPAIAIGFAASRQDALWFDRVALARGEWWRLWTGHWVHFSWTHAAWNLGVLLAAGTWLERRRPAALLLYTLVAAPLMSALLWLGEPQLAVYGGLSALATSVVTLLGLHQLRQPGAPRLLWAAIVGLVLLKSSYDATQSTALFTVYRPGVRASRLAHLSGVVVAFALHAGWCLLPRFAPAAPAARLSRDGP